MPLRRNRRQYEQLTDFDRGRIIGLREAGWSNRRIGRHLGRSDISVLATVDHSWKSVPSRRAVSTGFLPTSGSLSVTDWRRVIFSDESRFSLSDDDHRTRVWNRPAVRSGIYCRAAYSNFTRCDSVGSNFLGHTIIFMVLQGTLTARRYVDDILTPIVLPMLSSRPGAIYQQDNARPHTARLSQQCLQGYDVLPWPARSSDLSPIEQTRWEGNCSRPGDTVNCADAKTMAGSSHRGSKLNRCHAEFRLV
ncbi:transposable element Tc1 transposase [Trichonephila clavipes]|nr:transposable element Tc1 transposase [Trichonephila clavipes]